MEQAIRRVKSPYRNTNRKNEGSDIFLKYWSKFVIQTIISAVILTVFIYCKSVSAITTSAFWIKTTDILGNNITVDDMKKGIEKGVEYVKIIAPKLMEYGNNDNVAVSNDNVVVENTEINENEANIEEKPLVNAVTTKLSQEEEDINSILGVTTVLRPVNGEISSRFGTRNSPITGESEIHTGLDYAVAVGTQVKSAISGTVIEVKKGNASLGNFVRVKNSDIVTTYAHCSTIKVKQGDKVAQGDIIALSGNTGKSSGPHLHFGISKGGRDLDPEKLIF